MGAIKRAFANNITTSGNLTALSAANLTGTIADARFPATLPAISGANLTGLAADFKKLSTTTISSDVSDVTLEPANFSDYKVYCLIINRLQFGSDNMNMRMTIRDTSGSTYRSAEYGSRTGDGTPGSSNYFLMSWDNVGNNTSGSLIYEDYSAVIYMQGFEANRRFRYHGNCTYGDTSSNKRSFDIGGGTNYNEAVVGLKFAGSSGVIKSGQISLYGVTT
jgi:hypothetical protein